MVWNDALAFCKQAEKLPGYNKLSAMLTADPPAVPQQVESGGFAQSKKTEERKWLTDVSSVPLQQSLRNLSTAYQNYFDSLKGKRKGHKIGRPRFKKKTNQQSAEFTLISVLYQRWSSLLG